MKALQVLKIECGYDIFHDRVTVKGHDIGQSVFNGLDNIALKLREVILAKCGFDPGKEFIFDALRIRCLNYTFDPVRDYLDGLQWDGRPRLDDWLIRYCGARITN